jgi:type IV pilus assembly protein PilC
MVVHMVGIGEETGNVEEMLTNSAVYYEEEVEVQTQTLTSLMEPIIIVLMAFVVVLLIDYIFDFITRRCPFCGIRWVHKVSI